MSGSFDNLPRLQSLDEGEYGKISAGLRPPHSIFTTLDLEMKEAPALLVELGSTVIRRSRRFASCGRLTLRARRAGSAAGAGMFAFPWSIGMVFTNPAAIARRARIHAALATSSLSEPRATGGFSN